MNFDPEKLTDVEKFLTLNVANLDAMMQHFFSCLDNCKNFSDLKRSWQNGVKGVELNTKNFTSDEEYLKGKGGYTIREFGDYVRNDDGTPFVFKNLEEVDNYLNRINYEHGDDFVTEKNER